MDENVVINSMVNNMVNIYYLNIGYWIYDNADKKNDLNRNYIDNRFMFNPCNDHAYNKLQNISILQFLSYLSFILLASFVNVEEKRNKQALKKWFRNKGRDKIHQS